MWGVGTCDDEGTIFSFDNLNVTDVGFNEYAHEVLLGRVPASEAQRITSFYSSGGSKLPFRFPIPD